MEKKRNSGKSSPGRGRKSYSDDKPKRSFKKSDDKKFEKRSFDDKPKRSFSKNDDKPFKKSFDDKPKRSYNKSEDKPYKKSFDDKPKRSFSKSDDKPFKKSFDDKPKRSYNKSEDKPYTKSFDDKPKRSFSKNDDKPFKKSFDDKPKWASKKVDQDFDISEWDDKPEKGSKRDQEEDSYFDKRNERAGAKKGVARFQKSKEPFVYKSKKPKKAEEEAPEYGSKKWQKKSPKFPGKPFRRNLKKKDAEKEDDGTIRLNKYIANTGICSRREADELIQAGAVSINGKIVTEMGYKVKPGDSVNYGGQTIRQERKVYILLNKPKDYITTADDPQKRKTVLELIKGACKERVYPVGRLDRNTTGLLLLTNDGELTKKLTHPTSGIKKIYHVVTDKSVSKQDIIKLTEGFRLDDGFTKADSAAYVDTADSKKEIGVEMHSGKNRIVRRMIEHLGYKVVKLDRVVFAGLTKKDLPRGRWRFLSEKEIGMLKMIPS
jgi:23S rRNA pseudouridine2605 synthase